MTVPADAVGVPDRASLAAGDGVPHEPRRARLFPIYLGQETCDDRLTGPMFAPAARLNGGDYFGVAV